MDGGPESVFDSASNSFSSCLSPSALMGDSIIDAILSSSRSICLVLRRSAMCVSVEVAAADNSAGGVGCWKTSLAVTVTSSWVPSIFTARQLSLSSSGGHEDCCEVAATMLSLPDGEGVGISRNACAGQAGRIERALEGC